MFNIILEQSPKSKIGMLRLRRLGTVRPETHNS